MKYFFLTLTFFLLFLGFIQPSFYFYSNDFIYHYSISKQDFSNPDLFPRYSLEELSTRFYLGDFIAGLITWDMSSFALFFISLFLILSFVFYKFEGNPYLFLFFLVTPMFYNSWFAGIYSQLFASFLGVIALILLKHRRYLLSIPFLVGMVFSHRYGYLLAVLVLFSPLYYYSYIKLKARISKSLISLGVVQLTGQLNLSDSWMNPLFVAKFYVPYFLLLLRKVDFYLIPAIILFLVSWSNYRISLTASMFLCLSLSLQFEEYYKNSKFFPLLLILSWILMVFVVV